jgi:outer membrane protein
MRRNPAIAGPAQGGQEKHASRDTQSNEVTQKARSREMKLCRTILVGFLLLVLATPALAADVVKLGFFDMQAIIERSEIGKGSAEKFNLEKEKVREQLAAKLNEIKALDDEFKKKEQMWSQDVRRKKAQDIVEKKSDYDRAAYEANRHLGQLEQQLLLPIKDKVIDIVTRIGREEGYTMIWEMRRAGLAYAPPTLELTDRIIQELNASEAKQGSKPSGGKKQ